MQTNRTQSFQHIWNLLRLRPVTTRTELVEQSGLSKATVSEAVGQMLLKGILAETGKREPGRGRRQVVLELQASERLVIGAQITETGCHAVLTDLIANPIAWADRSVNGNEPGNYIEALASCVEELKQQSPARVLGIGVGAPGLISADGRSVVLSVSFGWENLPICDLLEEMLDLPVVTANRAKTAALGEYWQGSSKRDERSRKYLAHVHIGSGIVAGFVYEGALLIGHGGAAGELGHITMMPDGPKCACGNHGCLHMYASESAILRGIQNCMGQQSGNIKLPKDFEDVRRLLDEGDQVATDVVHEAGRWVGIAIASMINVVNPSMVSIGGSVAELGDVFMDQLRYEVNRRALREVVAGVEITRSELGENGGTIGAAALFIDSLDIQRILE